MVLAERLPIERWHPAVRTLIARRERSTAVPLAVAFSGGSDSLSLLLLMWAHLANRRRRLLALHFNHRLRGRAAGMDERFCHRVCRGLGIRLVVGRWNRPPARPSEEAARSARLAFFGREMARTGATTLWLGHTQNDVAETMLMRVARGSGPAGLAAPRPVQRMAGHLHVRPLLTMQKDELRAALQQAQVPWREDATNATGGYLRNRMRRDVLPVWQKASGDRDVLAGAALARELMEEDDVALEAWLDEVYPRIHGRSLRLQPLAGRPQALVRRALRRWLTGLPEAGDLSRRGFEDLLAAVVTGRPTRRSLGRQGFAVIRRGRLVFERTGKKASGRGSELHPRKPRASIDFPSGTCSLSG